MSAVVRSFRGVASLRWGGVHDLPAGTTRNVGSPPTPVRRRVVLLEQASAAPITELWSNATTGAYRFTGVKAGKYLVVAFDHTGEFAAEVESDIVVPAPVAP